MPVELGICQKRGQREDCPAGVHPWLTCTTEKSDKIISFLQKECGFRTILAWIQVTDLVWIDVAKMLLRSWKTTGILEALSPPLAPGPMVPFVVCALAEEDKLIDFLDL